MDELCKNWKQALLEELLPGNQQLADTLHRFNFGFLECDAVVIRWIIEQLNMPPISHGVIDRIWDEFTLFGLGGFVQINIWRYKQGRFLDCRCSHDEYLRYFQIMIRRARDDQISIRELNRCTLFVLMLIRVRELDGYKTCFGDFGKVQVSTCQWCT